MSESAKILKTRERMARGLCISDPRPTGCKIVSKPGEMFCAYCRRLIEGKPVQPRKDRRHA